MTNFKLALFVAGCTIVLIFQSSYYEYRINKYKTAVLLGLEYQNAVLESIRKKVEILPEAKTNVKKKPPVIQKFNF